jgi:alpha-1,2-mannosyltransferase
LYGTEPWDFYLKNGFLNFNFGLLLGLSSLPLALLKGKPSSVFYLSHFYLWLIIFSLQSHKEERFLYVIYPLICLNASFGLFYTSRLFKFKWWKSLVIKSFFTFFILLSISRILALVIYYRAPLILYQNLSTELQTSKPVNVCVGSEWYRFPSHCILLFNN